ncbi:Nn.00g087110.m01.CDS01 [Neocucurbitaria sp. VM-36]
MASNGTLSCANGGDWYICLTGTKFVGCCAVNPCTEICPTHAIHPISFDPSLYGKIPDFTCGNGTDAFMCSRGQTFLGCCKTNPCVTGECPVGHLLPAFADRPELVSAYGDPNVNFVGAEPLTTSSVVRANEPVSTSLPALDASNIGRSSALTAFGVSITIIFAICVTITLWFCFRRLSIRSHSQAKSAEQEPLPIKTTDPNEDET